MVRFDETIWLNVADSLIGIVGTELRKMKWSKILSLAPMHL